MDLFNESSLLAAGFAQANGNLVMVCSLFYWISQWPQLESGQRLQTQILLQTICSSLFLLCFLVASRKWVTEKPPEKLPGTPKASVLTNFKLHWACVEYIADFSKFPSATSYKYNTGMGNSVIYLDIYIYAMATSPHRLHVMLNSQQKQSYMLVGGID